jgi:DnaJ-class molecular chaperone
VPAASDTDPTAAAPAATDDARAACSPCRGTGQVVSNLGGEPATEACPWCEGSGSFLAEHDAQAARRAAAAAAGEVAPAGDAASAPA